MIEGSFEGVKQAPGSHRNETNETREWPVSQIGNTIVSRAFNNNPMRTNDERIQSFKELWRKEYDQDLTDAQALEYSENLLGFYRALLNVHTRIERWKERLVAEPKGFPVPSNDTYNCIICYQHLEGDEGWFDQFGIKCRPCQKAVEEGIIPGTVATDRKSWYSSDDLKKKFGWHHSTVAKKVRTGELKAREIRNGEHFWYFVFLKEENTSLTEPKEG